MTLKALGHTCVRDASITGTAPSEERKATLHRLICGRTITSPAAAAAGSSSVEGASLMADLAYALVFIGIFLVLVLTLRGLERL